MNPIHRLLTISALALGVAMPLGAFAQVTMDHSEVSLSHQAAMTDGVVKKVDLTNGKVTIKHGEILHMDMPGMTMVFAVKDKNLLSTLEPGDEVKFLVANEGGKLVVTDIQPAR
ncbi:copper-binding protein [Aquabacterium sp.]|jgi:Cu/Ag efflux protein CusF|uniref:copper-binding protein n=1 Tax=Aquabacterium sp. TaxID=1872578 RepID=UPI0035B13472